MQRKRRSLRERFVAVFLALFMMLSNFAGAMPYTVSAAANGNADLGTIKKGTDITTIDPSFDPATDTAPITFKYNASAGYKTNFANKLTNVKDYMGDAATCVVHTYGDKTTDGQLPYVMYYHVAKNNITGEWYDMKVTISNPKPASYKMYYKGDPNKVVKPFFGFGKKRINFYLAGIDQIQCNYQWFISTGDGTNRQLTSEEKAEFRSYVTLADLDTRQSFSIKDQAGLKGVYKLTGIPNQNHLSQISDGRIIASDLRTATSDDWGKVVCYMVGTDKFSLTYYNDNNTIGSSTPKSVELMEGGKGIPTAIAYAFTMESLFTIPDPPKIPGFPAIDKRVGDKGTSWDEAIRAESKEVAYEINDYDDYDYLLKAGGPDAPVERYEITDTLEACLAIDDDSEVTIVDKDEKNVTGFFDITVNGNTIKISATKEYLEDESFQEPGQEFTIRFTAHRRKDADVRTFMAPWIDQSDGYTFYVPNTANLMWHSETSGTQQTSSNECWVTDTIDSHLEIEKDALYDVWKVGDKVTYTVEVTQTKQDGYAVNLTIMDTDIPSGLRLLGVPKVSGPNYGTAASASSNGRNGWVVTCPLLMYGDSIKIEFECLALEEVNGIDTLNTASVTADNFVDSYGDPTSASDSAEVWINSPTLTVDKVADRYEYEVGDTVKYTVNVNNINDYTVAKNVVVSDISLPDGLELQGEPTVDMGDAQTSIGWPVADGSTSIATEPDQNIVQVIPDGNSWTVKAKYLPSGQPMQIVFNCKATKTVNGIESQNVVTATADNFLSLDQKQEPQTAQDDAEVYVNTAAFDIEKKVSDGNYEWQVGDHVPFDVTIRNINDENTLNLADDPKYAGLSDEEKAKIGAAGKTVARNVIITDKDIPDGFKLDFDSVTVDTAGAYSTDNGNDLSDVEEEIDALLEDMDEYTGENADGQYEDPYYYDTPSDDGTSYDSGMTPEEEQILQEAGIDLDALDSYSVDYVENGMFDEILNGTPAEDGTEPSETEPFIPRPAEEMTVTGIPDSFDDHVAGTPDGTNEVDETLWNETEPTAITHELTQVGNGWQLKISNLPAGQDVNVHFTCEALQPGNGDENVNIGTVVADNGIEKSDDAEAYINTAVLSIDKQLVNKYAAGGAEDKQDGREDYEFRVGEDVEYRLTVNNTQKGSIARNVIVSDLTIPEGFTLDPNSITVTGPTQYVNPIAGTDDPMNQTDPDHYDETEILPINYTVQQVEGGFQVLIDNVPCTTGDELNNCTTPFVITYHCTPTEQVNGYVIINTAKADADNAEEVKDTEKIWVNSPDIEVDKRADRGEYLVGDTITYTVDITQEVVGCVARDIVINDVIDTPGVRLDKSSIVLIDSEGYVIPVDPANVTINGNTFEIRTGMDLIKEGTYTQVDLDKVDPETGDGGYQQIGGNNPLGIDKESRIRVEYQVEIIDNNLAGQTIHNLVTVNSKENIPDEDEEIVPVYGPALDIVKESNKTQYQIGEEAQYKLTIRQLREDVVAKDVVVTDHFEKPGMEISKINVRLNGQKLNAEITMNSDNSFTIHTGIDMVDTDKLEVMYTVVFTDPSLRDQDIINVATAKGSNTEEERQDNSVRVVDENPGLTITKESDKEFYKVGDTGHYTITITNNEKGTTARNIIIKDQMETEGAKIIVDSIKIYNDNGKLMDDAEIQSSESRYAIYTGHDLEYKETMTVEYDVLFESESLAGKDILNIARATCDNLRVEVKDPEPILLSNGLEVYKYADPKNGSLIKNGDTINYSIRVTNTSNEDVKNVLVKDAIPDYMEYVSSVDQEGVVNGTRTLDGRLYATFIIESLPAGAEKTVTFEALVKDAPQEEMLVNVAQVRSTRFDIEDMTDETWTHESFRNTNEVVHYTDTRWVKDQNIVYIDGGKLAIDKVSDKTNYSVGETGHYTVTVSQKVTGAVARNVVVSDNIQKTGAYIQADSIKAYILRAGAEEPEEISDIQVTAKDYSYTVATNTNLAYGEQILIKYDVLFKDAALEGQQIKNVASVKDDSTPEGEEPTDDNRVTVGDAGLIIAKTSDKHVYKVGEVGEYTLKVTCSDPARMIENVVVKDVVKQQGAHLVTGTVRTYYDNEELKVNVQEKDNGFVVETGHDLSGTHVIWVTYDVVFEHPSLNGKDVENNATTWGDNTNPSDDTNIVHVGDEDPDQPPVDPDPTPDPGDPDDPTPTPDPGDPDDPVTPVKGMTLTKTANKHSVPVGETVSYTLNAKVNGDTAAKNVVISDTLDPQYYSYVEIVKDSFRAYIDNTEIDGEELSITSNGFTMRTGKDLAPGQTLKVTYDVLVKDAYVQGKILKNTAEVSSDNLEPAKDVEAIVVPTDEPTEPGLNIDKSTDRNQAHVGDTVKYTLLVTTTGTETAENVVIRDSLETSGAAIDTSSIRTYLDNAQFSPSKTNAESNGFTIETGKDLKAGQVMKVTYNVVYQSESLAGQTVKNTAIVSSDNMDPTKDNENIPVVEETDEPGLNIDKSADKNQAKVGDNVKYTLLVTTTGQETSKNVVIRDSLETSGAVIDTSSIKVFLDNAQFRPANSSVESDGFTIETGKDLSAGQTMKVTYNVVFQSESLAGKTVKNTAVVNSDNMDPDTDEENVPVKEEDPVTSGLSIVKSVDHSTVNVGETVTYNLTARTTSSATAEDVVITDTLDNGDVTIIRNSVKAYLNNAAFTPAKLSVSSDGFTMETGKDLTAKDVLRVTYQVQMTNESLAGKTVNNVAVLTSDNLDKVEDDAKVIINPLPAEEDKTPQLAIDKAVNLSEIPVGSTVGYTVTVRQTVEGQTAENVVIRDAFDTAGIQIGGVQVTVDGRAVGAQVARSGNGIVVNTNTDLPYGSTMKLTYSGQFADQSLAGRSVNNAASASADNAQQVAANAMVYVQGNEDVNPPTTPGQNNNGQQYTGDDTSNTIGPKTGLVNNAGLYAAIGILIVAAIVVIIFVMRRKTKKTGKK